MKLGTNIVDSCSKLGRIEGRSQAGDQSKTAVSHRRTHDVRNELRLSQAQAAKMIAHQRLQSRFPYSRTSSRRWREEKPMSGKAFRPSISPTSRTETKSFLFSHTDHLTTHQYALVEDVDGCGSEKKKRLQASLDPARIKSTERCRHFLLCPPAVDSAESWVGGPLCSISQVACMYCS